MYESSNANLTRVKHFKTSYVKYKNNNYPLNMILKNSYKYNIIHKYINTFIIF